MKRKKINEFKFIRNILIGIVSLLIVAFIINVAPGYKRDKYKDLINLIVNEENITEELKHEIYVNDNGTIYISEEDVRNLFDHTIYYDERYNQIITTSDTKVANIAVDEKQMTVNNSNVSMLDSIIRIDNYIYLPISDMAIVYNIKISYIKDTNRVVIDKLNTGMIKATATDESKIKFKPRSLSKNVGTLKQGEVVSCFYTTSKGWRQIRKDDGTVGYVKANKLGNEYIVRQDMEERGEALYISKNDYERKTFKIINDLGTKNVIVKDVFNINNNEDVQIIGETDGEEIDNKIWIAISNKSLESQSKEIIKDYKLRTNLIDLIVKRSIENNVNGVSIEFTEIEDKESMKRFVIECAPKLREAGISTCIVLNENIEKQDYINLVDYIVE